MLMDGRGLDFLLKVRSLAGENPALMLLKDILYKHKFLVCGHDKCASVRLLSEKRSFHMKYKEIRP